MKQQFSSFIDRVRKGESGWMLLLLTLLLPLLSIGVVFVVDFANSYLIKQKLHIAADAALHAGANAWKKNQGAKNSIPVLEEVLELYFIYNLEKNGVPIDPVGTPYSQQKYLKGHREQTYDWSPGTKIFTITPIYKKPRLLAPIINLFFKNGAESFKTQIITFTSQYRVDDSGPVIISLAFDISNSTGGVGKYRSRFNQLKRAAIKMIETLKVGDFVSLNTANAFWVDFRNINATRAANLQKRCRKQADNAEEREACDYAGVNWLFDATMIVEKDSDIDLTSPYPMATREDLIDIVENVDKFARAQNGSHAQGMIARARTSIQNLKPQLDEVDPEKWPKSRKVVIILSDGALNSSSADYSIPGDTPDDDEVADIFENYGIPAETTCNRADSGVPLAAREADRARQDETILFSVCVSDCALTFKDSALRRSVMKRIANVKLKSDEKTEITKWWKTGPKIPHKWPGFDVKKNGKVVGKAGGDDKKCGWYSRAIDCDVYASGKTNYSSCKPDNNSSNNAKYCDPKNCLADKATPNTPSWYPEEDISDILFQATSPDDIDLTQAGKELEEAIIRILDKVRPASNQLIQ